MGVSRDFPKLIRDLWTTSLLCVSGDYLVRFGQFRCVSGAWLRSDGSFEYQFLIDNTYFKFTLSAMSIILQCRYFVSVLARDARYCELQILYAQSRY